MYENLSSDDEEEVAESRHKTLTPRSSQCCSQAKGPVVQYPDVVLTAAPEEKHNKYDLGSRRSSRSNSTLTRSAKLEPLPKFGSLRINVRDIDASSRFEHWPTHAIGRKAKDIEMTDYDTVSITIIYR